MRFMRICLPCKEADGSVYEAGQIAGETVEKVQKCISAEVTK